MILMLVVFLFVLIMGVPIVFSFAFSTIVYMLFISDIPIKTFAPVIYSSLDSFPLLAIPLFLFAGELMSKGGLSKRIVRFAEAIVGKVRGYLGVITILASAFFSAVSGSGVATVAAVGGMLIPEMRSKGYPTGYAATLTASSAFLGVIIPPSIPMIMFGFISNTSIGDLFIGGIIPGVLFIIGFLLINLYYTYKLKFDYNEPEQKTTDIDEKRIKKIIITGKSSIFALLMPVIIIGGIYGGFFTPTESAVVAVVYSILIVTIIYRDVTPRSFFSISKNSALNTAMLMVTLVFATIFSRLLIMEQIPQELARTVTSISEQSWVILLIVILFLLFIGMLIDTITAVILVTPIVFPIAITGLGMDPVHFGVLTVVTLAVGMITPPMAINLFLASKIAATSLGSLLKYLPLFIFLSIVIVFLVAFIPSLSLFLPSLAR